MKTKKHENKKIQEHLSTKIKTPLLLKEGAGGVYLFR
jgi:hypothetical protein